MSKFMTLLVEDDILQREVLADVLREGGYEVVECATAEAAELVVATSGAELQALVTDQNLQGDMTGAELARFARHKYPRLNVIVMSGRETPFLASSTVFLHKPFDPAPLLHAVKQEEAA